MRQSTWQASFILLLSLVILMPALSQAPSSTIRAGNLTWYRNLAEATQLAQRYNKLLLVDVYTDWCGWCKRLDRETYSQASVQEFLNRRFVLVKENAEDKGEGQALAQKYQIGGYPCTLIIDTQGKLQGLIYGYRPAREFPQAVDKAIEKGKKQS